MGTLPPEYQIAEWRCTRPDSVARRLWIEMDLPDGSMVRFSISRKSAQHLSDSIAIALPYLTAEHTPCPKCGLTRSLPDSAAEPSHAVGHLIGSLAEISQNMQQLGLLLTRLSGELLLLRERGQTR